MAIANARVCDDLAFDSVFELRDEAGLSGKESRAPAVIKAEAEVRKLVSSILEKSVAGGHRTKAAKQSLGRLHSHVNELRQTQSMASLLPLLRQYAPVFRPLLSKVYDPFSEHTLLSDFSYSKEDATAIAADLAKRM